MARRAEEVIAAAAVMIGDALAGIEVKRNIDAPDRPPAAGMVIVRDGDPGEPEVTLSPLSYTYSHAIGVEVVAPDSATLDLMLLALADAVEADRTLGGLTEWLEPGTPDLGETRAQNAQSLRCALFDLNATYSTSNPLA